MLLESYVIIDLMFPYYWVTSTHNDVLLSLEYYVSATRCFYDTHIIALSQDHRPLHPHNYYKFFCYSHEIRETKYTLWVSGIVWI